MIALYFRQPTKRRTKFILALSVFLAFNAVFYNDFLLLQFYSAGYTVFVIIVCSDWCFVFRFYTEAIDVAVT